MQFDGDPNGDVPVDADDTLECGSGTSRRTVAMAWVLVAFGLLTVVCAGSRPRPVPAVPERVAGLVRSGAGGTHDPATTPALVDGRALPALPQTGPADVVAAVFRGRSLLVLRSTAIESVDPRTGAVTRAVRLAPGIAVRSSMHLVLDAAADRLWLVATTARTGRVLEFDASTLRRLRGLVVPGRIRDEAALGGRLYLATHTGVAVLDPRSARPVMLATARGPVDALAADPVRHRLIAVADATYRHGVSLSPGVVTVAAGRGARSQHAQYLGNFTDATVVVVRGRIWIGGARPSDTSTRAGQITRLDAASLAPEQTSPVALQVRRVVVTAGARDLWVSDTGRGLWCIGAQSGRVLQRWSAIGAPVASRAGDAIVISRGRLVPLVPGSCVG